MPHFQSNSSARVVLKDVSTDRSASGHLSTRVLELNAANSWTARVGRATSSGAGPDEGADNACYRSRVVSREHAYITANQDTGNIEIEDVGSMHGTRILDMRLFQGRPKPISQGDVIVFGASVERGDRESSQAPVSDKYSPFEETFNPIEVQINWTWHNEQYEQPFHDPTPSNDSRPTSPVMSLPNTFAVPEFSEEEDDYDYPDHEAARESSRVIDEPRRFVVPDSDYSDDVISIVSDNPSVSDAESPSSSPIAPQDDVHPTNKSIHLQSTMPGEAPDELDHQHQEEPTASALRPWDQPKFSSIAEILEDEAERMSGAKDGPRSTSNIELHEISDDEYGDEYADEYADQELDEFDDVDEFEDEDPMLAETGSRLQVPSAAIPQRDPSPSDAAMVKPITEALRAPPFEPLSPIRAAPKVKAESDARLNNAWAGHNSVLYDQPLSMVAAVYDPHPLAPAPHHAHHALQTWGVPLGNYQQANHIVDPYQIHQAGPIPLGTRKRKADRMDEGEEEHQETAPAFRPGTPGVAPAPRDHDAPDGIGDPELPSITVTETTDTIKSPPPAARGCVVRKKQKTSKGDSGARISKGSSFAKLATTAIAGAAIGAVGTILGLAALPPDYFV